ncbi:MAG: extracellular solute-binding protein [Hormoscilla sp.]
MKKLLKAIMNRRSFILGTCTDALGIMAGASLLATVAGCRASQQDRLRVKLLKNSIPAQLLGQFRKQLKQPAVMDFTPVAQLEELFELLLQLGNAQGNSPPDPIPDLVTLGDYWLKLAIDKNLIQPLNPEQLHRWQELPGMWQLLVKRNELGVADPEGKVWGAPYRWGSTAIVYRRDKFKSWGWEPTDWKDLWREELQGRISVLDQPREAIGLTLKKLGYSYNSKNLSEIPGLAEELAKLHQQTRFYSDDTYLQPLLTGDTWAAVGWSTDVGPVMGRYQEIASVVPSSGTALWADLWVRPASVSKGDNSLANQWIDFCWQKDNASQFSLLAKASSPLLTAMNPADLPPALRDNPILLPDRAILEASEFLLPLPKSTVAQYESLWRKIRML